MTQENLFANRICTNGSGIGATPSIDAMLETIERLKDEHRTPPPEIRLHPDDFMALMREVDPCLRFPAQGRGDRFSGVPVFIDPGAERLPLKSSGTAIRT